MSWTSVDLTQNADNLDWGTSGLGGVTSVSSAAVDGFVFPLYAGSHEAITAPSIESLAFVPGIAVGPVPEIVRPVSGPLEVVGGEGGGSARPASGMLYPRGQG